MMRRTLLTGIITSLIAAVLVTALIIQPWVNPAAQAKSYLEEAKANIVSPGPNDVVHYRTEVYWRSPSDMKEPLDPYHLPYSAIWPSFQTEDTWLVIGPGGLTQRWRTQLRDDKGTLLQDLYFDGANETDYFVDEARATTFLEKVAQFRDERVALLEDFLNNNQLSRRNNAGVNGKSVVSVYKQKVAMDKGPDTQTALLNMQSPFTADLNPVSQQLRIDFDPATNLPVDTVTVEWDAAGTEHVVSYRSVATPEILSLKPAEVNALFRQDIPAEAFGDTHDLSQDSAFFTNLGEIVKHVRYPLFASSGTNYGLKLVGASLVVPNANAKVPDDTRSVTYILASGSGVQMVYLNVSAGTSVNVIQGASDKLGPILKGMPALWTSAAHKTVRMDSSSYDAWSMTADGDQVITIVDTGKTLIYIDAVKLTAKEVEEFLQGFQVIK
jgi:hypothetical protein